jgi:hypothetical protein
MLLFIKTASKDTLAARCQAVSTTCAAMHLRRASRAMNHSIFWHLFSLHALGKVRPGSSKSKSPDTMEMLSCAQIHA